MVVSEGPGGTYRCSWCGKSEEQVRRLLAGPNRVYICDQCVDLCGEIIAEEREARSADPAGEQALREDVALANRVLERFGLSTAFGHASARIPGGDAFLLPTRASPAFAAPKRLLVLDFDGQVRSGEGVPNSELWIHARIYAARPDVGAVVHAHPPASIALAQIGEPFQVLHNSGALFAEGVPVFERVGLIRNRELGDELAQQLGSGRALLLRGHGIVVADRDMRAATVAACFLEEAADLQLRMLAAAAGRAEQLRPYSYEEATRVRAELEDTGPIARAWEYYTERTRR